MNILQKQPPIKACVRSVSSAWFGHTVRATYNQLVLILGDQNVEGDEPITHAEWNVVSPRRNFGCVYNWKTGFDPRSNPNTPVDWHIGSDSPEVAEVVALNLKNEVERVRRLSHDILEQLSSDWFEG